jgi:ADP-L-glycero-D-manno-heptose 6-epimerase
MASVAFHFNAQLKESGVVRLFRGSGGFSDGEQRRDFVFVEDVVKVNLWLLQNPGVSGIFNVGTGTSRSFNEMAGCIIDWHGKGRIEYVDMPAGLPEAYQSFTEADLTALRSAGYSPQFTQIEQGVRRYLDWLNADASA